MATSSYTDWTESSVQPRLWLTFVAYNRPAAGAELGSILIMIKLLLYRFPMNLTHLRLGVAHDRCPLPLAACTGDERHI